MIKNPSILYIEKGGGRYCGDISKPYGERVPNKFRMLPGYTKLNSERYTVGLENHATGYQITLNMYKWDYERYHRYMEEQNVDLDFAIIYRDNTTQLVSYQQVGIVNNTYASNYREYLKQEQHKQEKQGHERQGGTYKKGDVFEQYISTPISSFVEDKDKYEVVRYEYVYIGYFRLKEPKYSKTRLYTSRKAGHHYLLRGIRKYSKQGGYTLSEVKNLERLRSDYPFTSYTYVPADRIQDNLVESSYYTGPHNIYGIGAYIYSSEVGLPHFPQGELTQVTTESYPRILDDVLSTLNSIVTDSESRKCMSKKYSMGGYYLQQYHQYSLLSVLLSTGKVKATEEELGYYNQVVEIPATKGYIASKE